MMGGIHNLAAARGARPRWRSRFAVFGFCAAAVLAPALASGQTLQDSTRTGTILGQVVDVASGRPVANVEAVLLGTARVALTSREGEFRMGRIDAGSYRIELRAPGYEDVTQEVVVTAGAVVRPRFQVRTAVVPLEEVVVTGQAQAITRSAMGSSIAVIHADELATAPVSSLSQMLKSRVPGLMVLPGGGKAGQGSRIVLRGPASITRDIQPIIFVDGVRIYNSAENGLYSRLGRERFMGGDSWSGLDDINPDDVARIEILRGPAAATLYGTDGAAGVIQIFTRRGGGDQQEFTVRSEYGMSSTPESWWDVSEHGGWFYERFVRTGRVRSQQVTMRGGADRFTYYTSATMRSEEGVVADNRSDYWSFRSNMRAMPTQTMALTLTTAFSFREVGLPYDGSSTYGLGRNALVLGDGGVAVPTEEILSYDVSLQAGRFTAGASLEYIPSPRFTHRLSVGADIFNTDNQDFNPWGTRVYEGGKKINHRHHATTLTLDYHGSLTHAFTPDIESTTSLGAQGYLREEAYTMAFGSEFAVPGLGTVGVAGNTDGSEDRIPTEAMGLFLDQRVSYRDRLFFGASIRVDGHSSFGAEHRIQAYPSVSASYVASGLDLVPSAISTLRFRGAYGTAGTQPGEFLTKRTWRSIETGGGAGFITGSLGNPDLKPEVSRELEAGLDLGLLDNRLVLEATYYDRRTENVVFPTYQPPSSGFPDPQYLNIATIENTGVELSALLRLVERPGFRWDARVALATNENVVTHAGVSEPLHVAGTQWIRPGYPVAAFFWDSGEYIGPAFPTRTLAAGTSVQVGGGLRLAALLDHRGGHYLQSNTLLDIEQQGQPMLNPVEDHGAFVFPADSWRLREVTVSYELPASWVGAARVLDGVAVSIAGRNLWRAHDYAGLEAESSYAANAPLVNQTWFNTPLPRQIVAGIEVQF